MTWIKDVTQAEVESVAAEIGKLMGAIVVDSDEDRGFGPCDRFQLDYYDNGRPCAPNWRYCVCGWTEAHHAHIS